MKKTSFTLLILVLSLISTFSFEVFAGEYHVAKTGSDQNPGTSEKPFLSISAAAEVARAGDTVTVHEGIYRERVTPDHGGLNELQPIVYRAAEGERVVIKGSEIIRDWEKLEGTVWKVEIPNTFFGDYNPYKDLLRGDWLDKKGTDHHTGEVFLNGRALFEKNSLREVIEAKPYPDARNIEESVYTWCCVVNAETTTIRANFQEANPNEELVEINVRKSCFYPERPGVNYIIVQGFIMDQAATQWAAPTAEQIGLIGTHWSRGWIIEKNTISNSKCTGITLGKDRFTGQNVWMNNPVKDGATHYNEVIFRALGIGWSKEKIGSHIVRDNVISDCGQAGIVGSLGAVYSKIQNNHIYDIWTRRIFSGAEMAGIKIHASIDMLIANNRIHNTGRGLWLDWMAQGTRVSSNIFYDNTREDFFAEVNHGPYLVDNNCMLSGLSIWDMSEGGAYVHNLIAGKLRFRKELSRFTPYHLPHSTKVKGLRNIYGGDNRFYNNIFLGIGESEEGVKDQQAECYGLDVYRIAEFRNYADGNLYYGKSKPGENETKYVQKSGFTPEFQLEEENGRLYLNLKLDDSPATVETSVVTTERLAYTLVSEALFENPDGTPFRIDYDFNGKIRYGNNPLPGPFEKLEKGKNRIMIRD